MPARDFLRLHWPAITISVTAAAIACAALLMLRSMPPHRIVMATGPEGDAYYEVGGRYRAALARENVEVQLAATAGSVDNLALLRDPHSQASVALRAAFPAPQIRRDWNRWGRSSTSRCGGFRAPDSS